MKTDRNSLAFKNKSWHSRGYLPHYDQYSMIQSITFRLGDSFPQSKLKKLIEQLEHLPQTEREIQKRIKIEKWLDSGLGCCALAHPEMAEVMQDTLLKFHGDRYELIAWCIMPNHVHVLIEQKSSLGKIVQSWKSYTGRWAVKHKAELGPDH
jgi:type I restriction enzyme R subunit/putative DNA methylase